MTSVTPNLNLAWSNRRDAYRVRIPGAMPLRPTVLGEDEHTLEGRLLDVSRNGLSLLAPRNIALLPGAQFACHLILPSIQLQTQTELRSAMELSHVLRLGLRFTKLTPIERKQIETSLASFERSLLRDNPHIWH